MSLRSTLAAGFVWPCLPSRAPAPPSGEAWFHEIKHDGFRVIARKTNKRVRLYSRSGNDLTYRFPLIVDAMARLGVQSCIIDGHSHATQLLLDGFTPKSPRSGSDTPASLRRSTSIHT